MSNSVTARSFLDRVLEPPSYGYTKADGSLFVPTHRQLFRELGMRLNPFSTRKNWLAFFSWSVTAVLAIPCVLFAWFHLSIPLFIVGFIYSMVVLGTHGTVFYHRYGTHRAFQFSGPLWRFVVRNAVLKIFPDEAYIISHYVHHHRSEEPGDPYNVYGGWLYCFLADAIHQGIAKNLTEPEYFKLTKMLDHTGVRINSYAQYQKWGSLCHPGWTMLHFALNWAFWYGVFFLVGGHALALCLFGWSFVWALGIRTFNFDGHGGGRDKRKPGIDFDRTNLSINQVWPGAVTGEWHSNHHLYPNGARAGFLPYQLDYAWYFIRFYKAIGGITTYRDYKKDFMTKYYLPYLEAERAKALAPKKTPCSTVPLSAS